jgi:hypothetical protein
MKNSIKSSKHRSHIQRTAAQNKPAAPQGTTRPNRAMLVVLAVFTAVVTYGLCEYLIISKLPPEFVGQWVVKTHEVMTGSGADDAGSTIEFSRIGSVKKKRANGAEYFGYARLEDDILYLVMPDSDGTVNYALKPHRVLVLTESRMELEEVMDGSVLILERGKLNG